MNHRVPAIALLPFTAILGISIASAQSVAVVTFDDDWEGWQGPTGVGGATHIVPDGGNPGAHAQTIFNDFGITFSTDSHPAFIGDHGLRETITISIDVKVEDISMLGTPVPRELIVDFRSFTLAQDGYPWTSVWYTLTALETGMDWATYSVTFDPRSIGLPEGWGGYGAEDPGTFEPMLPEGVTFADVLAHTEEVAFTTLVPGWAYAFTDHNVRIDNIRIEAGAGDDGIFADGFEIIDQ